MAEERKMTNKIVVSIICNTYNHEKYIAQALDGFLMQKTNFKYEILIHDDASTDNTAMIIRKYQKLHPDVIKPIYQSENKYSKNININYNYQYPRAQGEYIAFCEGDDYWIDENKLQTQVDLLESNSQLIGCVHKYIVVDCDGNKKNVKTFGYYENEGIYEFNDFFCNELPSQIATLLCRNIFTSEKTRYPSQFSNIKIQGDVKLYLYLLSYGCIYRMSEVMSVYRFVYNANGNSWSSRQLKKHDGYHRWNEIVKLEKVYYNLFGIRIKLKQRRILYAIKAIKDLKTNRKPIDIYNTMSLVIRQRGLLLYILKAIIRKYKNEKR